MKRNAKTTNLEKQMITYKDLLSMEVKDNLEKFILLDQSRLICNYINGMDDMQKLFGDEIPVRKTIAELLYKAQTLLQHENPNYSLFVTYGYRSLEVQTKKFLEQIKAVEDFFANPFDLYEEAHRFIAVPTVAGHPTGGAIDIMILDKAANEPLDFGSEQYEYKTRNCYTFSENISKVAKKNRILLRNILTTVGFAPFDGEWWHFSYGDREWAYYYKKPFALYNQVSSKTLKQFMLK